MGEYAEMQWRQEMARGRKDPIVKRAPGRNPITANCPHCGKGIRPIAGKIEESMAQHIKDKKCNKGGSAS